MINRLAVFLDEKGDIPIRNSGLKQSELKNAAAFQLVELLKKPTKKGTMPKSFSHFRLTSLGRQFLRLALNQSLDPSELLLDVNQKLRALEDWKRELDSRLVEIHELLSSVGKLVSSGSSSGSFSGGVRHGQDPGVVLRVLRDAEHKASGDERFRNLFSTDMYIRALVKAGYSERDAVDALLWLNDLERLELQMGPEMSKNAKGVTTRNGRTYHWAKLRD